MQQQTQAGGETQTPRTHGKENIRRQAEDRGGGEEGSAAACVAWREWGGSQGLVRVSEAGADWSNVTPSRDGRLTVGKSQTWGNTGMSHAEADNGNTGVQVCGTHRCSTLHNGRVSLSSVLKERAQRYSHRRGYPLTPLVPSTAPNTTLTGRNQAP